MNSLPDRKSGGLNPKGRAGNKSPKPKRKEWGYLIMWEFHVREGMEKRFQKVCGPDGAWARFFAQDEAYIRTELIQDLKRGRIYVTVDLWTSQEAYNEFRTRHHARYKALDRKYEEMTESEREIGRFVRVVNT